MSKIFHSFKELAMAQGIDAKVKSENAVKCPKCGKEMSHVDGTNVWICTHASLTDGELKNGNPCQVFTRCGGRVLA